MLIGQLTIVSSYRLFHNSNVIVKIFEVIKIVTKKFSNSSDDKKATGIIIIRKEVFPHIHRQFKQNVHFALNFCNKNISQNENFSSPCFFYYFF